MRALVWWAHSDKIFAGTLLRVEDWSTFFKLIITANGKQAKQTTYVWKRLQIGFQLIELMIGGGDAWFPGLVTTLQGGQGLKLWMQSLWKWMLSPWNIVKLWMSLYFMASPFHTLSGDDAIFHELTSGRWWWSFGTCKTVHFAIAKHF